MANGFRFLKKLDMNPSTEDSFRVRTWTGALSFTYFVFVMPSLHYYGCYNVFAVLERIQVSSNEDMIVDIETQDRTNISLSIDFKYLPCSFIQIGYKDALGNERTDLDNDIHLTGLSMSGVPIGKSNSSSLSTVTYSTSSQPISEESKPSKCLGCYGAGGEGQCCNTCDDLLKAYRLKEWGVSQILLEAPQCSQMKLSITMDGGCRVEGSISINKVQGHVFIVPSRVRDYIYSSDDAQRLQRLNTTHQISHFSFGDNVPGQLSPFDKREGIMNTDMPSLYQYFVGVIPTTYTTVKKKVIKSYLVTETHHIQPVNHASPTLPGVYFVYDFSPLRSVITEIYPPLFDLCTSIIAILGGIFTMMGLVDGLIFSLIKSVRRTDDNLLQKEETKDD